MIKRLKLYWHSKALTKLGYKRSDKYQLWFHERRHLVITDLAIVKYFRKVIDIAQQESKSGKWLYITAGKSNPDIVETIISELLGKSMKLSPILGLRGKT